MTSPRALPPEVFLAAFPFQLWLDEGLRVVQVGAVLERLVPGLRVGAPVFDELVLLFPALGGADERLDAATLRARRDEPIVLEHPRTRVRLRGQLLALADDRPALVLLLEPWISDADELERWGLTLADFPIHSSIPEQLGLIRELRTSVEESLAMAERIEQQRRALAESQHRIATHLRHMPLAVIDWDTHGRIAAWNPAAARIFGIPSDQAIGHGTEILGMLGPIDEQVEGRDEPHAGAFDLLAKLNHRVVVEHRMSGGPHVLCAWHNTPLVDVDGNSIGVSSILRDVTESVRSERARRETQKLESLGVLAGGIAHDFNNLLAAVIGNADLALLESPANGNIARHLREITAVAERATTLTKQLLDYSGRSTYQLEPVEFTQLVAQMRPMLAFSLGEEVRLVVAERGELPPISGDVGQLRQVIMGLVVNASEAIGTRGGEIRISTSVVTLAQRLEEPTIRGGPLEPGPYVRIEVADDGDGISPELVSRIFDPFFSTKFTGRGLGLAAILGIIRGHRGALRVDSELGRGTRFELWFPALEPVAPIRVTAPTVTPTRAGKGRLLVVDDEAQVRRVLTTALSGAGFEVVAAAAGNLALELYDNDPDGFDLVLTDLTMPGLDGHELFAALTTRDPGLPVILSSGYSEHQGISRYPDGTPATFLKKPYRLGYLLAKVTEELGKRPA